MQASEIQPNTIYRHFKGGIYQVFGLACPESLIPGSSRSRLNLPAKHTETGASFSVRSIPPCGFQTYRYCHSLDSNEILVVYRDAEHLCKDTIWGREVHNFCEIVNGTPRFERLIDYPLISIVNPALEIPHQWIVSCGENGVYQAIASFGQHFLDRAIAYTRMMKHGHKEQDFRIEPVPFLE